MELMPSRDLLMASVTAMAPLPIAGASASPNNPTRSSVCMVVSASCVLTPAVSLAGTPQHDRVLRGHHEPAVIAICGLGPVNDKISDPSKPGWREA